MPNELVQGLLQDLLQPRKGPAPAEIMAAISSQNPMAAVAAMQAPQLGQMFGQQFRGLIGGLRGQPEPLTADEAMAAATQQIAAQPDLMNSSVGLNQLAKAAATVGRTAEAMQFSLMASQKKAEEDAKAKAEETARNTVARTQLQTATSVNAITSVINSLDPDKDAKYLADLVGFQNQVASGAVPADKVQSGLTTIATRHKQTAPEVFQFQAEWDAWKAGQAPGADTTYAAFLTWKENLSRQDSESQAWLKDNPGKSIEDYWSSKAAAQAAGRSSGTGDATPAVTTPTAREANMAQAFLNSSIPERDIFFGTTTPAIAAEDQGAIANAVAMEAKRLQKEKGGTIADHFQEATQLLQTAGRISVDDSGKVRLATPSNPLAPPAAADSFYN